MTPAELRAALKRLGLTQAALARRITALGGETMPLRTVQSWAGQTDAPPAVAALLALMERCPEAWRRDQPRPPPEGSGPSTVR